MRVLVVTAVVPWNISGDSAVLHHHLKHLAGEHEITILGAGGPPGERTVIGDGDRLPAGVRMRWFGRSLPKLVDHGIRRVRSIAGGEPAQTFWVASRPMLRALDEEIARARPDVLHLFGWGTAQLWQRGHGVPALHVAIDSWGLGVRNRLLAPWRAFLERDQPARIAAHERRHYPKCGAVVVVSPPDAEAVRAAAPGARVEVVPLGVDPGPEPGPPASDPVIGFHGAYVTEANHDGALALGRDVFPLIKAREPNARLLLIGRDPGPEILALARDGVEVTGRVEDVRAWLDRIAVYVAPMVSGQGMKHKILEAMAAGLPVVTTPMGTDGIGEGPGIRVGRSSQELADAAVALLRSPEERLEAGRAARRRVIADFTWERSARTIESLWAELATRGPAS